MIELWDSDKFEKEMKEYVLQEEKLEKQEIVVKVREVGKAKMYRLNMTNPVVKKFRDLYWETAKQRVHEKAKELIVA